MIKAVTLDLDGTVYLGSKPVEGAAEFIAMLRAKRVQVMFVTNRANRLPETIVTQLNDMDIECDVDDILTSSQAAADYLDPSPVYIIGETGLETALKEKGYSFTEKQPRYVIVSFDRYFSYEKLKTACRLIQEGAQFIATNPDQGLTMEGGIIPGTGSILAAVEAGTGGIKPYVIGKPEPLILEIAARKMRVEPHETLAVGDNIATDIPSGRSAGMMTAIILSGISKAADVKSAKIQPDFTANDYQELTTLVKSQLC